MKIYTKTGDQGETGLFAGPRVPKDDSRVAAYGTVDELSSAVGIAAAYASDDWTKVLLQNVQSDLFTIGAELATPDPSKRNADAIPEASVTRLENAIDRMEENLSPLQNFILPGGCPSASHVHLARSTCRRAERQIVTLARNIELSENVLAYFNRLSDMLFVLARYQNHLNGVIDTPWLPNS